MAFPFYQVVLSTVALLITYYHQQAVEYDKEIFLKDETNNGLPIVKEYDYIVIGGGSAGAVVANRLSKDFNVLLLEIGGTPAPQTYIPAATTASFSAESDLPVATRLHPDIAYQWRTTKQERASLINHDGFVPIEQGKALGGSSTVNGMLYNRGNPKDYDNWGRITGNDEWKYENLLKFFHMNENFVGEDNEHLGLTGPMPISKNVDILSDIEQSWVDAWKKAGEELGLGSFENSNGPQKLGFGPLSRTLYKGERVNTYDYFLKPIEDRKTLTISRYSKATKIDIDENKRAIGVIYEKHSIICYAKVKKEIIVSAGTINSPWILMHSGIGPEDQLKEAGIPVIVNLPVGQNFQDHPNAFMTEIFFDKNPYENLTYADVEEYNEKRTGALTSMFGMNAQAFFTSKAAIEDGHDPEWPDLQLITFFNAKEIFGGDNSMWMTVSLGLVKSRGQLTLNTTHPKEYLIIDPNYLADERDLKAIVEGAKIGAKAIETDAMKAVGARLGGPMKGCEHLEFKSDEYFECFVTGYAGTHWHVTSSCKMGKIDDQTAVLDSKLRVKGITGLRVIDNSIQPEIVNANTNAPAILIGQKGADMILNPDD